MSLKNNIDSYSELVKKVVQFRDDRDWKQFHNPKDLAISISIEAAELMECFQWVKSQDVENLIKTDKITGIKEEMADVLIYLINLADVLNVNLLEIAKNKIEKNSVKYPVEKTVGSSKKYTELN
jgi:NTP pyrophosphatase (non-canonical NTP hydrolase)